MPIWHDLKLIFLWFFAKLIPYSNGEKLRRERVNPFFKNFTVCKICFQQILAALKAALNRSGTIHTTAKFQVSLPVFQVPVKTQKYTKSSEKAITQIRNIEWVWYFSTPSLPTELRNIFVKNLKKVFSAWKNRWDNTLYLPLNFINTSNNKCPKHWSRCSFKLKQKSGASKKDWNKAATSQVSGKRINDKGKWLIIFANAISCCETRILICMF